MKKLTELLQGLEYTCKKDVSSLTVSGVSNDSRKAEAGSMFVAIKGAAFDGHAYAKSAYERGCRIFLCEREITELPDDAYVIVTTDTRKGLALTSSAYLSHPSKRLKIIAITGTKGKTTTACLIYKILTAAGKRAAYIGSNGVDYAGKHFETANTTPESCELHRLFGEMTEAGVEYVAMEVSSQALYLSRVYGIGFETVVFTNLAPDHIGGAEHPDYDHYKNCKRSLFFDYGAKNMVYNADDEESEYMLNSALDLYPISLCGKGSYNAENVKQYSTGGMLGISFDMVCPSARYNVKTLSPGSFSAYNAMTAIICAKLCGVDECLSSQLLGELTVDGRFECVKALSDRAIVIDYAHNGFSLRSVLTALKDYPHERLICLFGSVGGRTVGRRAELGAVAAQTCDLSIITSDNPDFESPSAIIEDIVCEFKKAGKDNYVVIPDREQAIKYAIENSRAGDVILLAGKGHEDYQLIEGKKVPFCERELVKKYVATLFSYAE